MELLTNDDKWIIAATYQFLKSGGFSKKKSFCKDTKGNSVNPGSPEVAKACLVGAIKHFGKLQGREINNNHSVYEQISVTVGLTRKEYPSIYHLGNGYGYSIACTALSWEFILSCWFEQDETKLEDVLTALEKSIEN